MYKIIFKGMISEPLFIDDVKGKVVMETWVADKKAKMVIGNTAFFTGDIKQVTKLEKSEAETAPQVASHVEKEYTEFRKKMLALPIEQRAGIIRIPKMIWASHTKQEMPEEVKKKIKEQQLVYFTENPKCIYANPKVYRDLIAKHLPLAVTENMSPIQNVLPKAMLRIAEELIRTDLQYSRSSN